MITNRRKALAREYAGYRELRRDFRLHGFMHSVRACGPMLALIRKQWMLARKEAA